MWNRWIEGNISCWIVLCFPHYIRCFYHQNMVLLAVSPTLWHCTGLFSCFSQYASGREREEDNFIWTKCEPLRNTQWLCHQFSIPFPTISPIVAIFGYPLGDVPFQRPLTCLNSVTVISEARFGDDPLLTMNITQLITTKKYNFK